MKAALVELHEKWPLAVEFGELFRAARAKIGGDAIEDAEAVARRQIVLGNDLVRCIVAGLVEPHVRTGDFAVSVSEKPAASRLARHQAEEGNLVTNRRHQFVRLNESALPCGRPNQYPETIRPGNFFA